MKRRNTPQYAKLLGSLLEEAVGVIQSNEIKVMCSPLDFEAIKALGSERGGLRLTLERARGYGGIQGKQHG